MIVCDVCRGEGDGRPVRSIIVGEEPFKDPRDSSVQVRGHLCASCLQAIKTAGSGWAAVVAQRTQPQHERIRDLFEPTR